MKFYFHDNSPAAPGEKHGARGPTHCATATWIFDYQYQLEMYLEEAAGDYPEVVRIECPDLEMEWIRNGAGKFQKKD